MRRQILAPVLLLALLLGPTAEASTLGGRIAVGSSPYGVAVDGTRGLAYVANGGAGTVSVIDVATDTVVGTVTVGGAPAQVAIDRTRGRVFVSNFSSADVAVIDEQTRSVVTTLSPGGLGLAIDEPHGRLYSTAGSVLALFDLDTLATVATVPSNGMSWWGVAVDPAAGRIYLEDLARDVNGKSGVAVLDANTHALVARVAVEAEARFGIVVDATRGLAYVPVYAASGAIAVLDTTTLTIVSSVAVGSYPFATLLDGDRLYTADLGSGTVTVLAAGRTPSLVESIRVGGAPAGLARTSATTLYVTDNATASVALVFTTPPNTAPVIDGVSVLPAQPFTDDVVGATVTAHDADGDPLTYTYQWTRNGTDIAGATSATLDLAQSGAGDRGDVVAVRVVASDGQATSAPVTSNAVTIANSRPTLSVALDRTAPTSRDVLTAIATASDRDGDALTFTYVWRVNGVVRRTTTTRASTDSLDLLRPGNGNPGDVVRVDVLTTDGTLDASASASVTVVSH